MDPIVTAPGFIAGLMLLWVGWFQLRYAATIGSDTFLLKRRQVAVGIRRLTVAIYVLAITVAAAPVLSLLGTQRAHQRAVTQLTLTIEDQGRQIEDIDRQLVEAKLRLEQANRQLSSKSQKPIETAAISAATRSTDAPVPASGSAAGYIHVPNAASVYLREAPAGRIIGRLRNGEAVTVEAGCSAFIDGHFWRNIRTSAGVNGWVIKEAVSTETSSPNTS